MEEVRLTPDKDFLIYKVGYAPKFVEEVINMRKLKGLKIFTEAMNPRCANIEFLAEYSFLHGLCIMGLPQYTFQFLNKLTALTDLDIQTEGTGAIDLSAQVNLEKLNLQWRKKVIGLDKCSKLKELGLISYKEVDLVPVAKLKALQRVWVMTGSLKTLEGIGELPTLQLFSAAYCRSLVSIKDLNGLQNLREIELEACTKITDYDALTDLPQLESLRLVNCKDIPSLGFIRRFPKLRELRLLGNTKVIDGDMSPAEGIEDAYCVHFKHYTRKIESERVKAINKANREMRRQRRLENKG